MNKIHRLLILALFAGLAAFGQACAGNDVQDNGPVDRAVQEMQPDQPDPDSPARD